MSTKRRTATSRGDRLLSHIPVVIITAYTDSVRRTEAEKIGVAGYYSLAMQPDKLAEAISRLLE
jgi:DNA-binding NarL/FixJ family response regulator